MALVVVVTVALLALFHTAPFPSACRWRLLATAPSGACRRTGRANHLPDVRHGPNPTATPSAARRAGRAEGQGHIFPDRAYVTDETAPLVKRMFDEGTAWRSTRRSLADGSHAGNDRVAAHHVCARVEQLTGRRPCRRSVRTPGGGGVAMFEALGRLDYVLVGWGWMAWDWNWFRTRTAGEHRTAHRRSRLGWHDRGHPRRHHRDAQAEPGATRSRQRPCSYRRYGP